METQATASKTIDILNKLLRGELSAVETYRLALDKAKESAIRETLMECQADHASRVARLRERIVALGGVPSEDSGAWGVFAKAVQSSADVFGEKTAVRALEEGEDHGLKEYRREVGELSFDERELVEAVFLPAQESTHRRMSALKDMMNI